MLPNFLKRFDLVPTLGLVVSLTTLTFQTQVLYPWHEKISQEIAELKSNKLNN